MSSRLVFFGTPDFAVPTLDALHAAGLAPDLVVTQPSRPVGRHRRVVPPPVARRAAALGLELDQPRSVGEDELVERLTDLSPEVCVVVAFGQIFPRRLLDVPRLGCVNVHASLLPRHRGAAPIQAAIAAGDSTTGVTTMLMEEGLDSGPILLAREIPIGPAERAGELSERLARLGGDLLVETLGELRSGALTPRPQDDTAATYARSLRRSDGRLDWTWTSERLERLVRAYDPWPGTFTESAGETVKVLEARVADAPQPGDTEPAAPGEIVGIDADALRVGCADGGVLALERVQRAGRRAVSGRELANGLRLSVGDRLG